MIPRSRHLGFTLIEVLIAAFIIALGVLGLLALFAGAARQQQLSSQQSSAVISARNAESSLLGGFGVLRQNPGASVPFRQDVWYRLPIHAEHNYLMSPSPGGAANSAYFIAVPAETLPRAMYTMDDPMGVYTTPAFNIPIVSQFSGMPIPPYDNPAADYTFPHKSLEPDSIRIEVEYRYAVDTNTDGTADIWETRNLTFERSAGITYDSDGVSHSSGLWVLPVDGDVNHDPANAASGIPSDARDYIIVDVQPDPESLNSSQLNAIHIGSIGGSTFSTLSGHVTTIRVLEYRWRNNQLVSLTDRVVRRADASAPDGVRSDQMYSVLFRQTATGSQAALVSYQLTAPSSTARFIPPETNSNLASNTAPIRRTDLVLRFDPDEDAYFFRVQADQSDRLWAIAPGQVLIVEGNPSAPDEPGSDAPVYVVRQVRESAADGGQWRGYLDRGPRAGDLAMLHPTDPQRVLRVFGVADTVVSRADSSVWRLTPLRMNVFNVSLSN